MDTSQQHRVEEIFLKALELAPEEQSEFLDQACADLDSEVRPEVEKLIEAAQSAKEANLSQLPMDIAGCLKPTEMLPDQDGSRELFGNYRLLRKIGEGGMGAVYLADQLRPVRRQVALKFIKPGMDSRQVIARFEAERQALALMDHPNIAKVLDASTTDEGRPYFVMELVQGQPITEHCDQRRLSLRERLELFVQVCQAVQHAHQKGIIHRDLKPSNVLVATYASQAVPKVIDFGIAKATAQSLTEKTLYTQLGQLVGTLEYMSPEQAQVDQLDIDTRSDIYSLGVLLYELLTGSTPLDRRRLGPVGLEECLRLIREFEPPRPSSRLSTIDTVSDVAAKRSTEQHRISTLVRGELDWIVMRALEKDRMRRYETADAFAADIARYLNDEPVVACPPSTSYRLRKAYSRNRKTLLAMGLVFLALVAGIIGTSAQWLRSVNLAGELQDYGYVADMMLANQAYSVGDMPRVNELLQRHHPDVVGRDLRGFEWHYLAGLAREIERVPVLRGKGNVDRIAFVQRDGVTQLCVCQDNELTTRRFPFAANNEVQNRQPVNYANEWYWLPCIAVAANADHFATINHAIVSKRTSVTLAIRSAETGVELDSIDIASVIGPSDVDASEDSENSGRDLRATSIALSRDGTRLITGHRNGTVTGWNITDQRKLEHVFTTRAHTDLVAGLDFAEDGKTIASASWDRQVHLFDFASGEVTKTVGHLSELNDVVFSADGKTLFSTTQVGKLCITDIATLRKDTVDEGVILFALAASPDGNLVAVGGEDGLIRIRHARSGQLLKKLRGHAGGLRTLAFSPDGHWLVSGGERGEVRLWELTDELGFRSDAYAENSDSTPTEYIIDVATPETFDLAFHPTRPLLAVSSGKQVKLWDYQQQKFESSLPMPETVRSVAFTRDGKQLIVGSLAAKEGVHVFDLQTHDRAADGRNSFDANVAMVEQDGRYVILSRDYRDEKFSDISIFDTATDSVCLELQSDETYRYGYGVDRSAISPSNRYFAVFAHVGEGENYAATIRVWDLQSGRELWTTLNAHDDVIHSLEFSPDGSILVSTSDDHTIKFWEPSTGKLLSTLKGHRSWVMESAFAPDGKTLATASVDGTVRLWDVASGLERFVFQGDGAPFICIQMSRDGKTIAAGNRRGKMWIWHTDSGSIK